MQPCETLYPIDAGLLVPWMPTLGALMPIQRVFLYMPLQHSESPDVQEESVAAFRALLQEVPEQHRPVFEGCLDFAELHQRIVKRFGRFPHRNAILGRPMTKAEEEYLANGGYTG